VAKLAVLAEPERVEHSTRGQHQAVMPPGCHGLDRHLLCGNCLRVPSFVGSGCLFLNFGNLDLSRGEHVEELALPALAVDSITPGEELALVRNCQVVEATSTNLNYSFFSESFNLSWEFSIA